MQDKIRTILARCGRLSVPVEQLADDSNLYDAGLSSLATVNVMLAIEETFDVEFPDVLLNRRSFSSIAALSDVVASLRTDVFVP